MFEWIVSILDNRMETPTMYGWFHLMMVGITIVTLIFAIIINKKSSDKTINIISFITWLIIVIFEIYKQFIMGITYVDSKPVWEYVLYIFPFQFCSLPFYTLPFVFLSKNEKIRDAFICFSMTYVFLAGVSVMIYPSTVFIKTIGINIQTMVHHGSQVFIGGLYLSKYYKKLNIKNMINSIIIFLGVVLIGTAMNIIVHQFTVKTFNMLQISPYYRPGLPVFDMMYGVIHPALIILLYFIIFSFGATLICFVSRKIANLIVKLKKKRS